MDQRFTELLLEYAQPDQAETRRDEIEQILWREFGQTRAVLVMDMTGFSLLTQKYGIIHYLSMVKRMQAVTKPTVEKHGGEVIKFEADNCFAAFMDVSSAVNAAIELDRIFEDMNRFTDEIFDIRVSIGIDYGDVLMIGVPDYFGAPVNRASKLGEDVGGPGEIYLTEEAFRLLPPGFQGEHLNISISGIELNAVRLQYDLA